MPSPPGTEIDLMIDASSFVPENSFIPAKKDARNNPAGLEPTRL